MRSDRPDQGRPVYLRYYVSDPEPNSVFVITAYELTGKPLMTYRCLEGERYDAEQIPSRLGRNTSPLSPCAYEEQTKEEVVAEAAAAAAAAVEDHTQTVMEIPSELVPAVRELSTKPHS